MYIEFVLNDDGAEISTGMSGRPPPLPLPLPLKPCPGPTFPRFKKTFKLGRRLLSTGLPPSRARLSDFWPGMSDRSGASWFKTWYGAELCVRRGVDTDEICHPVKQLDTRNVKVLQ